MAQRTRFHVEQSGVIAWRIRLRDGEPEFLLITSSNGQRWVIPKGHVEPDLSPAASARMEAWEEAGIKGHLDPRNLGSYEYQKYGNRYHVEVFLLEVEDQSSEWPEAHVRRRKWVSIEKAIELVDEPELKEIFRRADRRVARLAGSV